jgi:carboxyl-terminal processing protease
MSFSNKHPFAAAIFCLLLFAACKKEITDTSTPEPLSDTTVIASQAALVKDTVLEAVNNFYLWYKNIPSGFNARSYDGPEEIMTAIRNYSTEAGFADPVDRWSFAIKQRDWDNISTGIAGDFGLNVFFRAANDLRVKLVEKDAPAGRAGIRRGWRILKLNGNSTINTSNVDFVVDAVFNSARTTFTFEKPDGSITDMTLDAAIYQENPVILDSVYTVGGKKISYFAFNSFLGDTTHIYTAFDRIFTNFATQQLRDVIIDLRYNGGGYVSVQNKLADYLAPLAANNQLMMRTQLNDKLSRYNTVEYFKKLGTFNPSRLFFIVSKNTASASELLINNLRPYVDVQLIGPNKTYGKPVGYFPVPVGDWYVFPVSSRTSNKNGEGAYFDGLELTRQAADGLDKDWGDLQESSLANVVNYIINGANLGQAGRTKFSENAEVVRGNAILAKPAFKGLIETRRLQ